SKFLVFEYLLDVYVVANAHVDPTRVGAILGLRVKSVSSAGFAEVDDKQMTIWELDCERVDDDEDYRKPNLHAQVRLPRYDDRFEDILAASESVWRLLHTP